MVLDIAQILNDLPKPITLTDTDLKTMVTPVVTVKLDGIRSLLVFNADGTFVYNWKDVKTLDTRQRNLSVLDCEDMDQHYYIFDALCVNGRDVRYLPLAARLRSISELMPLPHLCSVKKYFFMEKSESL